MAVTESRSGQARNGEAVTDTDAGVLPPVPDRTRRASAAVSCPARGVSATALTRSPASCRASASVA